MTSLLAEGVGCGDHHLPTAPLGWEQPARPAVFFRDTRDQPAGLGSRPTAFTAIMRSTTLEKGDCRPPCGSLYVDDSLPQFNFLLFSQEGGRENH